MLGESLVCPYTIFIPKLSIVKQSQKPRKKRDWDLFLLQLKIRPSLSRRCRNMRQSILLILLYAALTFASSCLGFSLGFLCGPDGLPVMARIPPSSDDFSHCRPRCEVVCFLSKLSTQLLAPTTGKDRESLQSWTESPRIKLLFLAHGREEQRETLKKMEIDRAFALEISLHNRCLLCHPRLNQKDLISKPCLQLSRPCMPLPPITTRTTSGSCSHAWGGGECLVLQFSLGMTLESSPENTLVPYSILYLPWG